MPGYTYTECKGPGSVVSIQCRGKECPELYLHFLLPLHVILLDHSYHMLCPVYYNLIVRYVILKEISPNLEAGYLPVSSAD
jgi:hypothetical protein